MIEWQTNDSGHSIPFVEGRPLCSKVNPEREADIWSDKVLSSLYSSTDAIVVLGFGAGYHVHSLSKKTALKIYVVELLEEICMSNTSSQKIQLVSMNGSQDCLSNSYIKELINKKFQVFQHYPSTSLFLKDYEQLKHIITGRDKNLFHQYSALQTKHTELVNMIHTSDPTLLNAREISKSEMNHNSNTVKSYMWKILGEILK